MQRKYLGVAIATITLWWFPSTRQPAAAQVAPAPPPIPTHTLTPAQIQQLTRDLTDSSVEDFFQEGRVQLEREIQRLDKKRNAAVKIWFISDHAVM